jgi:dTDP-4-dehydrorhamnose reductase
MTPPILIVGGSGQLAVALETVASSHGLAVRRAGRPELDFDRPTSIAEVVAVSAPWLVVNAAGYTAVDRAEDEPDAVFRANRDGPAILARRCEAAGIPLIHVSTDYVFNGRKGAPYVETDPTAPQGVYGASKLAGELAVLGGCSRAIVLRTSWVYSPIGKNFVRTMLAAAQRTNRLRVVADQFGCPTSSPDLAQAILGIASRLAIDGTVWRSPHSRRLSAMASRHRWLIRSPPISGRPRRSGRLIRVSTAANSKRCSGCGCRHGRMDWREPSTRCFPRLRRLRNR